MRVVAHSLRLNACQAMVEGSNPTMVSRFSGAGSILAYSLVFCKCVILEEKK